MAALAQIETPVSDSHQKCLDMVATGTEDEQLLAQHAIQRAGIVNLFPELRETLRTKMDLLQTERIALLAQEKQHKQDGDKSALKAATKAKGEVNARIKAHKECIWCLGRWESYSPCSSQENQCDSFRRWRQVWYLSKKHIDADDRDVFEEIICLAAPV
jgi:hypothetical protein